MTCPANPSEQSTTMVLYQHHPYCIMLDILENHHLWMGFSSFEDFDLHGSSDYSSWEQFPLDLFKLGFLEIWSSLVASFRLTWVFDQRVAYLKRVTWNMCLILMPWDWVGVGYVDQMKYSLCLEIKPPCVNPLSGCHTALSLYSFSDSPAQLLPSISLLSVTICHWIIIDIWIPWIHVANESAEFLMKGLCSAYQLLGLWSQLCSWVISEFSSPARPIWRLAS